MVRTEKNCRRRDAKANERTDRGVGGGGGGGNELTVTNIQEISVRIPE